MYSPKIDKEKLKQILRDNLQDHIDELTELRSARMARYRTLAYEAIAKADEGEQPEDIILPMPPDHRKDYEQVLRMLELTNADEVELDSDEFKRYVMNDWPWQTVLRNTAASYR